MTQRKKIDGKRFYTLGEIVREGLIPGVDSIAKMSRVVAADRLFNNILRSQFAPVGKMERYQIRGSNIIRFLNMREDNG